MRVVTRELSAGSQWDPVCRVAGIVLALLLIASCGKTNGLGTAPSVVIEREVLLQGVGGRPNALAPTPDGGFVVVGNWNTAWAVAADRNGAILWKYSEPAAAGMPSPYQSEFHGVVALDDGNILLCGQKYTKDMYGAVLTILDGSGHLVEERRLFPTASERFSSATFSRCQRWGDGIAAIGSAPGEHQGFGWLMKLDSNGKKQWEVVDTRLAVPYAIETPEGDLLMAEFDLGARGANLVRVNTQGQMIETGFLKSLGLTLVRSAPPTAPNRAVIYGDDKRSRLIMLDDRLQETQSAKLTPRILTDKGGAWRLSDGSVALFGNVFVAGVYRAAIGHVGQHGTADEVHVFSIPDPRGASLSVMDAVPLSGDRFVTVRDQEGAPQDSGVVLSWVTFK